VFVIGSGFLNMMHKRLGVAANYLACHASLSQVSFLQARWIYGQSLMKGSSSPSSGDLAINQQQSWSALIVVDHSWPMSWIWDYRYRAQEKYGLGKREQLPRFGIGKMITPDGRLMLRSQMQHQSRHRHLMLAGDRRPQNARIRTVVSRCSLLGMPFPQKAPERP
jgi:hypothetical protein